MPQAGPAILAKLSHRRVHNTRRAIVLLRGLVIAILVASAGVLFRVPGAEAQKRIYIANDDHTDYFWTGTDVQYRAAFLSMLDYYLNQIEATAGNPSDSRARFNCDGSLWVRVYEQNRSAANFARLVGRLRDDTLTMPLNTLVLLYGAMPTEAVLRDMYYAGRLALRRSGRARVPSTHGRACADVRAGPRGETGPARSITSPVPTANRSA
jgi:hypothetical protein